MNSGEMTVNNMHEEIIIPREEPIRKELKINGRSVTYEVDTGCGLTIMSRRAFQKLWKDGKKPRLVKCKINLRTYSGHRVKVLGASKLTVEYQGISKVLPVVIVKGLGPSLVGLGWIKALKIDWQAVHKLEDREDTLQEVLSRHEMVFKDELGMLKGFTAKIHVASDATPCFYKPRSVPLAMKKKARARETGK